MKIPRISLLMVCLLCACDSADREADSTSRKTLTIEFLNSEQKLQNPLPTTAFLPPLRSEFQGVGILGAVHLENTGILAGLEIIDDSFSISANESWQLRQFPSISIELVSDGSAVIPVIQTPQRTSHPYWELVFQAGRQWPDPDMEGWNRVALPFALKEKNQNCIHNGMIAFAYQDNGQVSRVAWQVSSETCSYLKINLWGLLQARYQPGPVEAAERVITTRRINKMVRMPVTPLESLINDHPTLPLQSLIPADKANTSVHGFVMNGIHYRGGCQTRHGPYPFCDELILPSYSLAKSIFAGIYYLHMTQKWPEFSDAAVSVLIPECRLADGRWDNVRMSDLINMTTGNYDEATHGQDEFAKKMQTFFLAESHADKIRFACEAWAKKAEPGTKAVYHTTDDYLLGTAMSAWVRQKTAPEADIFTDFLFPHFFEPLKLSPLMAWTQRTYDEAAQPFTAYGLVMQSDDLARLSMYLSSAYGEQELLDQQGFQQAMFHDVKKQRPLLEGSGLAYKTGFWGVELSPDLACRQETWIPFMSGYGGISVALFPNSTVYYHFSDGNEFSFRKAAVAAHSLINMCVN